MVKFIIIKNQTLKKRAGLIDEIGSIDEAKDWLEKELEIKANVCVYE